jgi:hypothetical protein
MTDPRFCTGPEGSACKQFGTDVSAWTRVATIQRDRPQFGKGSHHTASKGPRAAVAPLSFAFKAENLEVIQRP